MMKDAFPKPYAKFIHYIEDNWDLTQQVFEGLIVPGGTEKGASIG